MSNVTGPTNCAVHRAGEVHEDPGLVRYGLVASAPAPSADEVETSVRAVEVIVMWGDNTVLSVDHLSPIRSYYVGEGAAADFAIGAELLGAARMPLVIDVGGKPAVVIPAGASGDVSEGGGCQPLADLISSGRAQPCAELADAYQYPLAADASARIVYRGLCFVVRSVQAGRAVGMGRSQFDPKRSAWTLASFSIHAAFLLATYFMPPGSAALSLELLSEDSRRATYLMQPPETSDEQTPDWLPTRSDDGGGQGERHEGADGQMGKQDARRANNKYAVKGAPDSSDPRLARTATREETKTAGILGVLLRSTGAWNAPTSPFGAADAVGHDPVSARGLLMGAPLGDDFGFNGLGMRGTGRGAGGDGQGTIGTGKLDTFGHGGGGGSDSGYGRGVGSVGGRTARVPRIHTSQADVRGSLSKDVIRREIQRHLNEVRYCYEQALSTQPELSGRVQVKFVIMPSGVVQAAKVEQSSLGVQRTEQCIADAVRRWTFPAPDGGGVVIVSYPFLLQAAGE